MPLAISRPHRNRSRSKQGVHSKPSRRLRLELLEDRSLLSILAGSDDEQSLLGNLHGSSAELSDLNVASQPQKPAEGAGQFVPGEILVGFEGAVPAVNRARGAAAALEAAGKLVGAFGLEGGRVLFDLPALAGPAARLATHWLLPDGADVLETVSRLSGRVGIAYAEPNWMQRVAATLPNDPRFGDLWGLHNTGQTGGTADADIDAPEAWDITTGSSQIVVGVIDTGVDYNHPDLAANMWTNPGEISGNGIDDDGNGFVDDYFGYDFVGAGDPDPFDDHSHGTHVSGTVGAVGDNGTGVVGVNWNVKIMALKFLDAGGSGSTTDAIEAVDYATIMRNRYVTSGGAAGANVRLTSNSWGGGGFSQALQDAIAASGAANMLFVAAAGNGNSDNDANPSYPASYPLDNIISVAATDRNDARASFSNYGATSVDLGAPGVDVLSTTPGNTYSTFSGTSMATPHVSGAAALAWGIAPTATYQQIRDAIFAGVDPVASMSGITMTGGRLNAFGTLKQIGMVITGSTPAAGSVVFSQPTDFVIGFSFPVDANTLLANDLTVNTIAADSVALSGDGLTATFHYGTTPVTAQGVQTMAMPAGAVTSSSTVPANPSLQAWTDTFRYDAFLMQVDHTHPANGVTVTLPFTTLTVQLNEDYDPFSVGTDDLVLNQGSVTAAVPVDGDDFDTDPDDAVQYTLTGITQEGTLTVNMAAGALTDVYGNPMAAYAGSFDLDFGTVPYPIPLEAKSPLGSLIYDPTVSGFISFAGDSDSFTIAVDPGQTITVVVDPDTSLRPAVELRDPSNGIIASASAAVAGQDAVIQTAGPTSAGTYTITVSGFGGTSTGAYQVQLILNAAVETESHNGAGNDSIAAAQDINASFIPLADGATRGAVIGGIEDTGCLGPDGFGYEACALTVPTFEDISGTGTVLTGLNGVDDASVVLRQGGKPSGFAFNFYGTTYVEKSIYVSSNGLITFGSGYAGFSNTDLSTVPDQAAIAPFWDDLFIEGTPDTKVLWQLKGSGTDQYLVIQWNQVRFYGGSGMGDITFQAILRENFGNPYIQLNYPDLESSHSGAEGKSATVGIKAAGAQGPNRLLVSQNAGPNQYVGTGLSTRIAVGLAPNVETPDYYAFSLAEGQRLNLALKQFGGNADLELRNSSDTVVASGTTGATNVDEVISFVATTGGMYYARVTGQTRAQYHLVAVRGGYFDLELNSGPAPWLGDPAQTVQLNSSAVVLGHVGRASSGGVVGYFTDFNESTTSPEAAILQSGFTPLHITNIGTFDLNSIDVLMVNESNNGGLSTGLSNRLTDIQAWVTAGGVFIVHDRFVSSGPAESNPFLVGRSEIRVDRDFANGPDLDVIPPGDTLVIVGPHGTITNTNLDGGNSSNHGFALGSTLLATDVRILSAGPDPTNVAALSYGLGSGVVYYSTIPLDFYLAGDGPNPPRENLSTIYTPNALSYVYSLAVPEVDFYKFTIPAGSVPDGGQIELSTLTPADGSGEPVNTLNAKVRLYDASGVPLAEDDDSGPGLNALLMYPISASGVDRTFYVQVLPSDGAGVAPSAGEYVLRIAVNPLPPSPGITVSKTSVTTTEAGGADTFTVRLNTLPTADVTIAISSSDTTEGTASPTSLTFTSANWDTPQTVTLSGLDDFVDDGDIAYTIVTAAAVSADPNYNTLNAADVGAVNIDNDTAGITVSPTSGLVTTEAGATASFTVVLDSEPLANVTIDISSSDTTEGLVSAGGGVPAASLTLTFTAANWSVAQTVTVHGQNDLEADRNVAYTIVTAAPTSTDLTYNGMNAPDVSVVNLDNDTAFETIENFDDGNMTEYKKPPGDRDRPAAKASTLAAHDGTHGLEDKTNSGLGGWLYRDDAAVLVQPGDLIGVWVRSAGTPTGRGYFGFGASASGTYSVVMAPNTGSFDIGKNINSGSGYGYQTLASVAQSWVGDHWYRFEVDWQAGGTIIARLYDSDALTLLNTVTANDTTITSGGIAFRSFDSTKHFDTVQRLVTVAPTAVASVGPAASVSTRQSQVVDAALLARVSGEVGGVDSEFAIGMARPRTTLAVPVPARPRLAVQPALPALAADQSPSRRAALSLEVVDEAIADFDPFEPLVDALIIDLAPTLAR